MTFMARMIQPNQRSNTMSKWWQVEVSGDVRELYDVQADSEEEAMANWQDGIHVLTEVTSSEPVSAKEK